MSSELKIFPISVVYNIDMDHQTWVVHMLILFQEAMNFIGYSVVDAFHSSRFALIELRTCPLSGPSTQEKTFDWKL